MLGTFGAAIGRTLKILALLWGALLSLFAFMSNNFDFMVGLLVTAWAPLGVLYLLSAMRSKYQSSAHAAAMKEAGAPLGRGLDHCEGGSGIGLNPAARLLTLHMGGVVKTYRYDEVRDWEIKKEQMVGQSTWLQRRHARQLSGLFVRVRDVERAEWRIEMTDTATLRRWMEILQQELNEGGIARRAA